jgi:hypothetical protein
LAEGCLAPDNPVYHGTKTDCIRNMPLALYC